MSLQITEISSKLSAHENCLDKLSIKKQINFLSLQIRAFSSKLSAHENCLDKMSTTNISKFETPMKENEELLNTNIDTKNEKFKSEASISINKTAFHLS